MNSVSAGGRIDGVTVELLMNSVSAVRWEAKA